MDNGSQYEKFELGTVSLFVSLTFLTVLPHFMRNVFIFLNPDIYRIFGGFFMVLASIFYIFSPAYYKRQFMVLGLNFILFSIFQIFYPQGSLIQTELSKFIPLIIGVFLICVSIYMERIKT